MSSNSDPQQKNRTGLPTGPDPSLPQSTNDATASDAKEQERQEEIAKAARNVLADMKLVGPIIVWVKLKFGWVGILLILAGFLLGVILAYTGQLPNLSFSDDKSTSREYELVSDPGTVLKQALNNAKSNMEVSGVALTFIDTYVLKEKLLRGFRADIVFLDPCSDASVKRIEAEEGSPTARTNAVTQLTKLKDHWLNLPTEKRGQLQVKLSQRPATMIVSMFDRRNDLYTYPCPFGGRCTDSHILVFKNYGQKNPENGVGNQAGHFFEKHYDALFRDAGRPVDFSTYDPNKCPTPSPEATAQP